MTKPVCLVIGAGGGGLRAALQAGLQAISQDAQLVADADLERAANGAAWAGYQNAGQSCGGVARNTTSSKGSAFRASSSRRC